MQTETEITVETKIKVDPDFVEMLLKFSDWFRTDQCGYWARGLYFDKSIGWLFVEMDEDGACSNEQKAKFVEAERIWRADNGKESLPTGFFSMDKNTVLGVIREGVKRYGPDFQENNDANTTDVAIQLAFLHEVRYG